MKTFTWIVLAVIAAAASAIDVSTAAIERELAEYERQLGTDVSPAPTGFPPSVSFCVS